MSDQDLRDQLAQLETLYEQGLLSEANYRAALTGLGVDAEAVLAGPGPSAWVQGAGTVAQDHSVAAGADGVAVGRDVHGDVLAPGAIKAELHLPDPAQAQEARARSRYLTQFRRFCNALPLAALGGEEGADEDVTLEQVYIDLDTRSQVPLTDEEKKARSERAFLGERDETRPLTALEAAVQERRLVLLGDPGGGKSTFVRQLLGWLAAHRLGEGKIPPGDMGALLPVLITLRDLIPALQRLDLDALPAERRRVALAHLIRDHVLEGLARLEAAGFADGLAEDLSHGRCFVAFDGLDEVPQALRRRVRLAIQAVLRHYAPAQVIVTCRIRSYAGEAALSNFKDHTLAPFDQDKIRDFVSAWYRAQRDLGRVDAVQADEKAADLSQAASTADLIELASNPMLLTTMAIIHQREIGLPSERVRLYKLAVDVLLSRWHKRKMGEETLTLSAGLVALLGDERRLHQIVELLAHQAHRQGRGRQDAADLSRGEMLTLLEAPAYLGDAGLVAQFLDYVDRRAGLLVGRGGAEGKPGVYSFPHRTFQEYLAGCHIVSQQDPSRELWQRVREGDYWSLAARLGAEELFYNRRGDYVLLGVAYRLCPGAEPDEMHTWRAALWSGHMAALLGRAFVAADDGAPDGGPAYLERLLARLVRLLRGERLGAYERAEAGRVLAALGDPRAEVLAPGAMAFCHVPAGPFWMGSPDEDEMGDDFERPLHRVDILYDYWLARYPVTVAQFRAFVEASGSQPGDPRSLHDPDNHPVRWISWHEARAFCAWLTRTWQEGGALPEGWQARLPTEAEWEKGARGGLEIPSAPFVASVEAGLVSAPGASSPNPTPRRRYPWGDEPDPNRANYDDTGIDTTSAVGCFPGGVSPYGCLDMSGNVWEWTSSLWGKDWSEPEFKYPYDPADGRENLKAGDRVRRVLRGGAFHYSERSSRCALRGTYNPLDRDYDLGFRVLVAAPFPHPPLHSGPSALGHSGTQPSARA